MWADISATRFEVQGDQERLDQLRWRTALTAARRGGAGEKE